MRHNMLVAALAGLLAFGCAGDEDDDVSFTILPTCLRVDEPREAVFRTAEEWAAFQAAHPGTDGGGASVDFTRSMVVARFDGPGSACTGFTVEGVQRGGGSLVVRATRHTSPNPCIAVLAYPQVVLTVPRGDEGVGFRIADAQDEVPTQTQACR